MLCGELLTVGVIFLEALHQGCYYYGEINVCMK